MQDPAFGNIIDRKGLLRSNKEAMRPEWLSRPLRLRNSRALEIAREYFAAISCLSDAVDADRNVHLNYAQIRRSHRRWSCGDSGTRVNSVISQVVFSAVSLPV